MSSQNKKINYKRTLTSILDSQEKRMTKRKARSSKDKQLSDGLDILIEIMNQQNKRILNKIQEDLNDVLPIETDLIESYLKINYQIPDKVKYKKEVILNNNLDPY